MVSSYYHTENSDFTLYQGDTFELLRQIDGPFDMIFADPPYFLSTGNGKVNVNGQFIKFDKGQWDRVRPRDEKDAFNRKWLEPCTKLLKQNGTIWVCGTYHNIFSIEKCLDELGFKIINFVVWQKPDPPVTLSDKRFNFCAEYLIWATRKSCKNYTFNMDALIKLNGGVQMQDVWKLSAASTWEKQNGKHPTQKPLRLLYRAILASTKSGDRILDPFAGSSTTGIAANLMGRQFVGIDESIDFLNLSIKRKEQINNPIHFLEMKQRMEEDPEQVTVLVNHARPELKSKMFLFKLSKHIKDDLNTKKQNCDGDCPCLWESKIFQCGTVAFIDTLNSAFKTDFYRCKGDYLEVNDLTSDKYFNYITKPIPFCRYCMNCKVDEIEWSQAKSTIDDYVERGSVTQEC